MTLQCQPLQSCQLFSALDERREPTLRPLPLDLDLADAAWKIRHLCNAEHMQLGVGLASQFERCCQCLESGVRAVIGHENLTVHPVDGPNLLIR